MLGHYNAGKRQMRDGDFLLMDFAPDYGYYMSDLTRTWPVNGKFSSSQRELYEFYAGCYRAILKAIKPGLTARVVLQTAVREMDDIFTKMILSKQLYNQAAKAFVETFRQSSRNPRAMLGHWGSACLRTMWGRTAVHSGRGWCLPSSLRSRSAKNRSIFVVKTSSSSQKAGSRSSPISYR